jgi:hypothetical protein
MMAPGEDMNYGREDRKEVGELRGTIGVMTIDRF